MKQIFAIPLVTMMLSTPLVAQEQGPSLMERGAQLFFDGLIEEMAPALDEMAALLEDAGPALQDFVTEMGPKLRNVLEEVEDWSVYTAPEVLPNGDIIIRRKPDLPNIAPDDPLKEVSPQIDL
ncbi:hypothetical protein [Sulfitobacter sp.]|uniref:hypothetical protein n=1 Tax=Sulfitobacter sp. TaxID=1903071 RepID=UPI0030025E42